MWWRPVLVEVFQWNLLGRTVTHNWQVILRSWTTLVDESYSVQFHDLRFDLFISRFLSFQYTVDDSLNNVPSGIVVDYIKERVPLCNLTVESNLKEVEVFQWNLPRSNRHPVQLCRLFERINAMMPYGMKLSTASWWDWLLKRQMHIYNCTDMWSPITQARVE